LNGKRHNLDYGAAAAGAPPVFLNDSEFDALWKTCDRCYFVASNEEANRIETLVGKDYFQTIFTSGGKLLLANVPHSNTFTSDAMPRSKMP
jgi:hypothetical protein